MDRAWEGLFADLEAQLQAQERLGLDSEVADRTRRERAAVDLHARLVGHAGGQLALDLTGGHRLAGRLADVGDGWLLLEPDPGGGLVVRLAHVLAYEGLGRRSADPARARRFGLGHVLRGLARDRSPVSLLDVAGRRLVGTVDAVGADHLDLAEHDPDEPRRAENVRRTRVVPFDAVVAVRR